MSTPRTNEELETTMSDRPTPETDAELWRIRMALDIQFSDEREALEEFTRNLERQRDDYRNRMEVYADHAKLAVDAHEQAFKERDEAREEIAAAKAILQQVDLPDEPLLVQAKRMVDQHDWQLGINRGQAAQIDAANQHYRELMDLARKLQDALRYATDNCLWRAGSEVSLTEEKAQHIYETSIKALTKAKEALG